MPPQYRRATSTLFCLLSSASNVVVFVFTHTHIHTAAPSMHSRAGESKLHEKLSMNRIRRWINDNSSLNQRNMCSLYSAGNKMHVRHTRCSAWEWYTGLALVLRATSIHIAPAPDAIPFLPKFKEFIIHSFFLTRALNKKLFYLCSVSTVLIVRCSRASIAALSLGYYTSADPNTPHRPP